MSDLHIEFDEESQAKGQSVPNPSPLPALGPVFSEDPRGKCDVAVLAGDIGVGAEMTATYLIQLQNFLKTPIVFVAGNHEGYRNNSLSEVRADIKAKCAGKDIYILEKSYVDLEGYRFIGATFWTDFKIFEPDITQAEAAGHAQIKMTDWKAGIGIAGMTIRDSIVEHMRSKDFIEKTVADYDGHCVIVTHHAMHRKSIIEKYAENVIAAAYVSDCTELLQAITKKTPLCVHGHTHYEFDYRIEGTRIVCNPRGYRIPLIKTKIVDVVNGN